MALDTHLIPDTIAAGTALSAGAAIGNYHVTGLIVPTSWTTGTVTLRVSQDGVNWAEATDTFGNALAIVVTSGAYVVIPPYLLPGPAFLQIRSGTVATPVNQATASALSWVARPYS